MNKKLAAFLCVRVIALCVLLLTEKTWAQADDFSLGGFVGGQLAEAFQYLNESREACHRGAEQIQALRQTYYGALRSGRGVEAARNELYRLLDGHDFGHIGVYVIGGVDSPAAKLVEKQCPPGSIVHPKVSRLFFDLVRELRSEMGAKRPDDIIFPFDPTKLFAAMQDHPQRATAYVRARNLTDLYASGVPTEKLFSAETYLKILLEMEYTLPSLSILKPDMDKLPQERFDLAVAVFGKKSVMEAAETVLKLPKNIGGDLATQFVADGVHGTTDPLRAFNEILKTEPKGFVVFAQEKEWMSDFGFTVTSGSEYYDELVSRHGKNRVHEVVNSIRKAPRIFGDIAVPHDGGYETKTELWFLEELLANPNARIPSSKNFVFLAAGDTDAIIKSKDKIQVVYGRVNDVRWADGGRKNKHEPQGRFYVFFAGVSKFAVMFYEHHFRNSFRYFGEDAQGLNGKLLRVQGYVWQRTSPRDDAIKPDWFMRGSDGDYSIVAEEDWPDYLPIPEKEPARSLDELKAAVTPIVLESIPELSASERLKEAQAAGRAGGLGLLPLNCREDYPAPVRIHELSSDQYVRGYLNQMMRYAFTVGEYQALSEMCSSVANPAVRGDFLLAAVGGLDEKFSDPLDALVDKTYQPYCRQRHIRCPENRLEYHQAKYQELMIVLRSGDLQRTRDSSVTVSQLPAVWKRYALTIGQYEVMSEACSGSLDPAIRDDFFAALESASTDQAVELTTMIDSSYEKYSSALKQSIERWPANEDILKCRVKGVRKKYQRIMTKLAAE